MANLLQNFNLPRDPFNVLLVVDLFFLKNFDSYLIESIHNAQISHCIIMATHAGSISNETDPRQNREVGGATYLLAGQNMRALLDLAECAFSQGLT